ncbi:uncharacterized protein LAJ45_03987 [Morchella importuna]|uniref:uncharacterized protein n=1 Tax=Morchella importuna TaxID=1174673 RepID=UPI001E8E5250|nr:uncharacterized protein LAJ45_03987 [Morchella importuna]KAH8151994.1 hypothetical protein LAJ45_03987 [Morchella importuna]
MLLADSEMGDFDTGQHSPERLPTVTALDIYLNLASSAVGSVVIRRPNPIRTDRFSGHLILDLILVRLSRLQSPSAPILTRTPAPFFVAGAEPANSRRPQQPPSQPFPPPGSFRLEGGPRSPQDHSRGGEFHQTALFTHSIAPSQPPHTPISVPFLFPRQVQVESPSPESERFDTSRRNPCSTAQPPIQPLYTRRDDGGSEREIIVEKKEDRKPVKAQLELHDISF